MAIKARRSPALLAGATLPVMALLATCVGPGAAGASATAAVTDSGVAATPPPARVVPAIRLGAGAIAAQGALLRGTIVPADATLTLNDVAVPVAPDGHFIIGLDRDHGTSAVVRLTGPDGSVLAEQRLDVRAGNWSIQHVNAPARGGASSDTDFNRRRPGEIAQMAAARRTVVTSEGWRQDFIWPVRGRMSGVFGSQRVYQGEPGSYHNGVDVAVPAGTPYVAPADGVVILAATTPFTLEGYLLMIDHGMGLSSVFLHSSRLDVSTGDAVRQGQVLGAVGATGRTTGPHMHWAMRWSGAKIDAAAVAGPMQR